MEVKKELKMTYFLGKVICFVKYTISGFFAFRFCNLSKLVFIPRKSSLNFVERRLFQLKPPFLLCFTIKIIH